MPMRACHISFMQTSETYMIGRRARIHQQCDPVLLVTCCTKRGNPKRSGALPLLRQGADPPFTMGAGRSRYTSGGKLHASRMAHDVSVAVGLEAEETLAAALFPVKADGGI